MFAQHQADLQGYYVFRIKRFMKKFTHCKISAAAQLKKLMQFTEVDVFYAIKYGLSVNIMFAAEYVACACRMCSCNFHQYVP